MIFTNLRRHRVRTAIGATGIALGVATMLSVVGLLGGALFSATWATLSILCIAYLAMIPFSIASYAKVRRLRAAPAGGSARG